LGIIGPIAMADLTSVKDIRNQFAHSFHPLTFRAPAIATRCRNFRTLEKAKELRDFPNTKSWPPADPRLRYQLTCWILWVALGGKSVNRPRPRRSRDKFSRTLLS
jgi:hypothetical protein